MEWAAVAINAAVIVVVGSVLGWLGKRRFNAIDRRFDAIELKFDAFEQRFVVPVSRFEAVVPRIGRVEQPHEHGFDVLEYKMDSLQASLDAMRAEMRQVLLALGVTLIERCPVLRPLRVQIPRTQFGGDSTPCHPRRRATGGRTSAIRS